MWDLPKVLSRLLLLDLLFLPWAEAKCILNDVSLVLLMLVSVVVALPYVCVTLSIPVIFQPVNVYPVLVGLLIVIVLLYVADVGCDAPCVPLSNAYDIV